MKLRPTKNNVLLEAEAFKPSTSLSIIVPEKYVPDQWIYRVVACGSAVTPEIKPGMRVFVDPTLLSQKDFETGDGKKFKLVESASIQMVIGVVR